MVFTAFILISLKTRRKEMNAYFNAANNLSLCSVDGTRYTRLALLSLVDTFFTVPLSIFVIAQSVLSSEVKPYPGWAVLLLNFNNIPTFSAGVWREATNRSRVMDAGIWFSWLVYVFCAVTVFAFFGWGEEVRRGYLSIWVKFLRVVGIRKEPAKEEHEVDTIVFADGAGSVERTVQRDR